MPEQPVARCVELLDGCLATAVLDTGNWQSPELQPVYCRTQEAHVARRSRLSAAEKAELVLKFLRREDTAGRLAPLYGVSGQTLYRYRVSSSGPYGLRGHTEPHTDLCQRRARGCLFTCLS